MYLYVMRVATDDNIADLPSRLEFCILNEMGAIMVEPVLLDSCLESSMWEVLQERWAV